MPRDDVAFDLGLIVLEVDVLLALFVDVVLPVTHHTFDALLLLLGTHLPHAAAEEADCSIDGAKVLEAAVSCLGPFSVQISPGVVLHVSCVVLIEIFQVFHEFFW